MVSVPDFLFGGELSALGGKPMKLLEMCQSVSQFSRHPHHQDFALRLDHVGKTLKSR